MQHGTYKTAGQGLRIDGCSIPKLIRSSSLDIRSEMKIIDAISFADDLYLT